MKFFIIRNGEFDDDNWIDADSVEDARENYIGDLIFLREDIAKEIVWQYNHYINNDD